MGKDSWNIDQWKGFTLPIGKPPCQDCKYWNPQKLILPDDGEFDGIRCCWVENMYFDFSCYKDK